MTTDTEKTITLPFFETIRRSFLFVFVNFKDFAKITLPAFILIFYEMLTGFQSICSLAAGGCENSARNKMSLILLGFVSIALAVAYCRRVILKEVGNVLTKASLRRIAAYFLYNIGLLLMIAIPSYIFMITLSVVIPMLHLPDNFVYVIVIVPLLLTLYFSRFFLVFSAVAVDDYKLNLKKSFALTKGNANRIFWGQIVMMVPGMVLLFILNMMYNIIGSEAYAVNFVFMVLFLALSFFDTCLKASYYAHIYQYFTFYQKHKN